MRGSPLDLTRTLVVGGAQSGLAALRAVSAHSRSLALVDDRLSSLPPEALSVLRDGFFGTTREFFDGPGAGWPTTVVASPGVRPDHPILASSRRVIGEIELAWRLSDCATVGVTGTNGKTTVTKMITEMFNLSGRPAVACGNVGVAFSDVLHLTSTAVVEVSSFQLNYTSEFRPDVAVWTNFTPDHLDYHGSLEAYFHAKEKIFANQSQSDVRVLNLDDSLVVASRRPGEVREIGFSVARAAEYCLVGRALVGHGSVIAELSELKRSIPHELANLLASAAAAEAMGADRGKIREYFLDYDGFEHRIEFCGAIGGVRFYNDSKATTPASVIAAVTSFENVVLIAGGRNKGLDLGVLGSLASRLRGVVAIGECAKEIIEVFAALGTEEIPMLSQAPSMREAVRLGYEMAKRGDVVLLSPGVASFDWYDGYESRGRDFKSEVLRLGEGQ